LARVVQYDVCYFNRQQSRRPCSARCSIFRFFHSNRILHDGEIEVSPRLLVNSFNVKPILKYRRLTNRIIRIQSVRSYRFDKNGVVNLPSIVANDEMRDTKLRPIYRNTMGGITKVHGANTPFRARRSWNVLSA